MAVCRGTRVRRDARCDDDDLIRCYFGSSLLTSFFSFDSGSGTLIASIRPAIMIGFLQLEHANIYNSLVNHVELEKCPKNRIVTMSQK